jgi:hypothetical protein
MASKRSSSDGRESLWKEHMSRVAIGVRRSGSNSPTEEMIVLQKETTFKESKKKKGHKFRDCSSHDSYTKEAQFVRKLKRGFDKSKGKLPFKCFNCGRVGHFDSKCPYVKRKIMMMQTVMINKNITIKKTLYTQKSKIY